MRQRVAAGLALAALLFALASSLLSLAAWADDEYQARAYARPAVSLPPIERCHEWQRSWGCLP